MWIAVLVVGSASVIGATMGLRERFPWVDMVALYLLALLVLVSCYFVVAS